jgi:hypothetical protein
MYGATGTGGIRRHTVRRQRSLRPWQAMARCGATLTRPVTPGWGTACQTCARAPRQPREPGTLRPLQPAPELPLKVRAVQAVS